MKSEMADFDEYAGNYREIHTQNVKGLSGADSDYFSEYKIVELAGWLEGASILDFGCGDGNSAFFIKRHIKDFSYKGVDVSEESIKKAKERSLEGCEFCAYDGLHIPFQDETFDIVFAACVFHHIEAQNHVSVLREIHRVLKKGGKVIIFEHNPLNPLTVKTVHDCPFDVGVKLIRGGVLKKRLKQAGFSIICTNYTIFMPRKGIFKKLLPIEKLFRWLPFGGQYYSVGEK